MRLGTCLLYEGRSLQGAPTKLADFCSAPLAGFYAAVDIMVALAIIALIVGLTAPRVMGSFGRAKSQAAEVQLQNIKGALQLYYIDNGRYPTEADGLKSLMVAPQSATNWHGPYIENEAELRDPWGRLYLYKSPGLDRAFNLETLGRDGHVGGSGEDRDIGV